MPSKNLEKIRASRRKWYKANKEKAKEAVFKRRAEIKTWYEDLKSSLACEHCGEDHPATLEFHHDDPSEKDIEIAKAVADGWSLVKIEKEISKCTVLCSNCHRKLHYEWKRDGL